MRLKLPETFSLSVPARKVVLLPDAHFFCRAIPVAAEATQAEVAAQVELALEAMAPFPLAQMYHGHFWRPGAKNAFVFAAYRKRFPAEQLETWAEAEAVLPLFACMLNLKVEGPTTLLLWSEKSLTAVNWDEANDVPVSVIARELPPEASFADHVSMRESVLQTLGGGTRSIVESATVPTLDTIEVSDDFLFHSEHVDSSFTREQLDMLDVRDKEELAARRRARFRDLILWRVLLGCAAALLLSLTLEVVLVGGHLWQKGRMVRVDLQEPGVSKIRQAKALAEQIEELSTKRMRPFEMISMVFEKQPASVVLVNAAVAKENLYTLDIDAQASVPSDVNDFSSAVGSMPSCASVEVKNPQTRNGLSTFRMIVTFKPDAFKSAP